MKSDVFIRGNSTMGASMRARDLPSGEDGHWKNDVDHVFKMQF